MQTGYSVNGISLEIMDPLAMTPTTIASMENAQSTAAKVGVLILKELVMDRFQTHIIKKNS
jgi:hypothetical protein